VEEDILAAKPLVLTSCTFSTITSNSFNVIVSFTSNGANMDRILFAYTTNKGDQFYIHPENLSTDESPYTFTVNTGIPTNSTSVTGGLLVCGDDQGALHYIVATASVSGSPL
jgi:hypothetical protein